MPNPMITDGTIENFKEGWALPCGHWGKAHHYKLIETKKLHQIGDGGEVKMVVARCGHTAYFDNKRPLFNPGSFDLCKRCQSKV